jgi:hypothetical protein
MPKPDTTKILAKINQQKQPSPDMLCLNLSVAALKKDTLVPFQRVIARLGDEKKEILIPETGEVTVDVFFANLRNDVRQKLQLCVDGESSVTELEIVPEGYEATLKNNTETALRGEFNQQIQAIHKQLKAAGIELRSEPQKQYLKTPILVTKDNFEEEVLQSDLPILVYFFCLDKIDFSDSLTTEKLALKYAGKIKIAEMPDKKNYATLIKKFNLSETSCTVLFKDGSPEVRKTSAIQCNEEFWENFIDEFLKTHKTEVSIPSESEVKNALANRKTGKENKEPKTMDKLVEFLFKDFLSLVSQVSRLGHQFDDSQKQEIVKFYENTIHFHEFEELGSLELLERKIILLQRKITALSQKSLALDNIPNCFVVAERASSHENRPQVISNTLKDIQNPDSILFSYPYLPPETARHVRPHKSGGYDNVMHEGDTFYLHVEKYYSQLITLIKEVSVNQNKHEKIRLLIPKIGNLNLFHKIAELINKSSQEDIPKEISKNLKSVGSSAINTYNILYEKEHFLSIEDIVSFEIKRYEEMASGISDESVNNVIALTVDIEKHVKAGDYPLAWLAFKDAVALIKSSPDLAGLLYLPQFESEWGKYIAEFDRRFAYKKQ